MKIELSEKAKKEIAELEERLFGHYTKEEREFFKTIRSTCEFYLYQVYEMEHLDRKGKRDWIKRLVESKVKEERERILKIINDLEIKPIYTRYYVRDLIKDAILGLDEKEKEVVKK